MPKKKKVRKAVQTINETPCVQGRRVRKGRHLNINAPTSDFSLNFINTYRKKH